MRNRIASLSSQLENARENVTNLEKTLDETVTKFEGQVNSLKEQHDLTMQSKANEHANDVATQLKQYASIY